MQNPSTKLNRSTESRPKTKEERQESERMLRTTSSRRWLEADRENVYTWPTVKELEEEFQDLDLSDLFDQRGAA